MRNRAQLPRTNRLRTLNDMSQKMTEAGLDPGRIQARAKELARAKAARHAQSKEEEEMAMDLDVEGVDLTTHNQSSKQSRKPRINRQLAGLRNAAVSWTRSLRQFQSINDFL